MDDPRWEPGMPVLDRQSVPESPPARSPEAALAPVRAAPPRTVPETAPTPLQKHYINLSAIALVAGAVAITALETGSTIESPVVRIGILVASPILIVTTADASIRIWRSAWAWMPVDRNRGLFRLAWLAAAAVGIAVFAAAGVLALTA
ncbi:MAG TPA: hypothetical protein VFX65_02920 [Candidatus Limnocylindrales bacterium]|nr:hypothetical protein [Candidatus Limnocylindrales bacterium]